MPLVLPRLSEFQKYDLDLAGVALNINFQKAQGQTASEVPGRKRTRAAIIYQAHCIVESWKTAIIYFLTSNGITVLIHYGLMNCIFKSSPQTSSLASTFCLMCPLWHVQVWNDASHSSCSPELFLALLNNTFVYPNILSFKNLGFLASSVLANAVSSSF